MVPFENIVLTASIAANCELQMLAGTSFSAAVKNWMACVIMSSAIIYGCVLHTCVIVTCVPGTCVDNTCVLPPLKKYEARP